MSPASSEAATLTLPPAYGPAVAAPDYQTRQGAVRLTRRQALDVAAVALIASGLAAVAWAAWALDWRIGLAICGVIAVVLGVFLGTDR